MGGSHMCEHRFNLIKAHLHPRTQSWCKQCLGNPDPVYVCHPKKFGEARAIRRSVNEGDQGAHVCSVSGARPLLQAPFRLQCGSWLPVDRARFPVHETDSCEVPTGELPRDSHGAQGSLRLSHTHTCQSGSSEYNVQFAGLLCVGRFWSCMICAPQVFVNFGRNYVLLCTFSSTSCKL